jgi:hypothetical protein
MEKNGFPLELPVPLDLPFGSNLDDPKWESAEIQYQGRLILLCELTRITGKLAFIFQPSKREWIGLVKKTTATSGREQVLKHLAGTHLIVEFQLLSEMLDDDFPLLYALCNYFIDRNGGLFHADNEGFKTRAESER